jgi:hypothetical protein
MEFGTVALLALGSGELLLQRQILHDAAYDGPRPALRTVYRRAGAIKALPALRALADVVQSTDADLMRATLRREAAFAQIVAPLLPDIDSTALLGEPRDYRQGWLVEQSHGLDLDAHAPRVEGSTLRFRARQAVPTSALVTFGVNQHRRRCPCWVVPLRSIEPYYIFIFPSERGSHLTRRLDRRSRPIHPGKAASSYG